MKKKITISKYPFIKGTQCLKSIYLHYHSPELKTQFTQEELMKLDKGKEVGILARNIFRGGIDVSQNETIFGKELIHKTAIALESGGRIFYEPGFESADGKFFCRVDLMVRSETNDKFIEVKSSTSIKTPEHIYDIGFQWKVLMENGFNKKTEMYIAYLNRDYVKDGTLDVEKLFVMENVTRRAKDVQPLIERYLNQYDKVLEKKYAPSVDIGERCFKPYPCEFKDYCWKKMPEISVFNIGNIRKAKAAKMYSSGIIEPIQIPRNAKLNESQWIEVDSAITNKPSVNSREIEKFLQTLEVDGPMLFVDFETMMPAIPIYNGTRPYQQICFQYCVLYRKNSKSEYVRREFLAESGEDPRRAFIENLLNDTREKGNIIVYNEKFEITRLKELAELFPEHNDEIIERISRIKDLMAPFAKRHYYHPLFKGKHSIKVVLPVICPEMRNSYSSLTIHNGSIAMNKYETLERLPFTEQLATRSALKEYCFTDVLAMVKIADALKQIVNRLN